MAARNRFADQRASAHDRRSLQRKVSLITRLRFVALLLLPGGVLLAAAGGHVEKSFQTTPNPRISISNPPGGTVVVRGWDKSEVHAVCSTSSSKAEIDVEQMPSTGEAEKVRFSTHVLDPQAAAEDKTATYELDIPAGASLDIYSPQGSVSVERTSGDDWVETISGKVSVTDAAGRVTVHSLNGNIELVRLSGQVEAISVIGNLQFTASTSPRVRAQTESGRILFDGDFVPSGEYILKSYAGDMDITCPASDSFELSARSLHGKVDNQVRLNHKGHAPIPSGSSGDIAFGFHNQGDATVNLKSFSGTIHVRPRP
ncbi:MAG TPA: hypothetical protein VI455_12320 [Terriglobia bacterium]